MTNLSALLLLFFVFCLFFVAVVVVSTNVFVRIPYYVYWINNSFHYALFNKTETVFFCIITPCVSRCFVSWKYLFFFFFLFSFIFSYLHKHFWENDLKINSTCQLSQGFKWTFFTLGAMALFGTDKSYFKEYWMLKWCYYVFRKRPVIDVIKLSFNYLIII